MLSFLSKDENSFDFHLTQFLSEESCCQFDSLLHNVMQAFRGEDQSIKSQIAFAQFKRLIISFQNDINTLKTIKILIVLDKLVQQKIFCEEISLITIFSLEKSNYQQKSPEKIKADKFLRLYWRIIKAKSTIIIQKQHIFQQKRSQRHSYLQKINCNQILYQIGTYQTFFSNIFQLTYSLQQRNKQQSKSISEWRKLGLIDHVLLQILFKLLYLYNCQMMVHTYLLKRIIQMNSDQALRLKRHIIKFREHCNKFIVFIKQNKNCKGFEYINYEEVMVEINEKVAKFIEEYLQVLQIQSTQPILKNLEVKLGKIEVEQRSVHCNNSLTLFPRLNISPAKKNCVGNKKKQSNNQCNPFSNWQNSYSHQFPQKQVMTVDLILQIKLQESLNRHEEQQISQSRNQFVCFQSCIDRSTCSSSSYDANFVKIKFYSINQPSSLEFSNSYSKFPSKWNNK